MPKVFDSRVFDLPQAEIYALLMDITAYPAFIPFVRAVRIVTQKENVTEADIRIGVKGIDFTYRCTITETPVEKITVRDIAGPFKFLRCEMIFEPVSKVKTRVTYSFESQFKNRLMNRVADPVFNVVLKSTLAEVERFLAQRFLSGRR